MPNTPNTGGGSNTASNGNSGGSNSNSNSNNSSNNSGGNANSNSNNNNNGGGNVTPPATKYIAWVKDNTTGQMLFSQECSSWASASAAASSFMNSAAVTNLIFDGHDVHSGVNQA